MHSFINRPCDSCGSKENPVYQRYEATSEMVMKFKIGEHGKPEPVNTQYWCNDCFEKNKSNRE